MEEELLQSGLDNLWRNYQSFIFRYFWMNVHNFNLITVIIVIIGQLKTPLFTIFQNSDQKLQFENFQ